MEFPIVSNSRTQANEELKLKHDTLIVKVVEFSKGQFKTTYHDKKGQQTFLYKVTVFTNGNKEDEAGYVSLQIHEFGNVKAFEGSYIISLIDVADNQCFTQTFEVSPKQSKSRCVYIPKYIACETLLRNSDEYIPDDTLTLQVDIFPARAEIEDRIAYRNEILRSSLKHFRQESFPKFSQFHRIPFPFDSLLEKVRTEESYFAQQLLDMPMIEKQRREIKLPPEGQMGMYPERDEAADKHETLMNEAVHDLDSLLKQYIENIFPLLSQLRPIPKSSDSSDLKSELARRGSEKSDCSQLFLDTRMIEGCTREINLPSGEQRDMYSMHDEVANKHETIMNELRHAFASFFKQSCRIIDKIFSHFSQFDPINFPFDSNYLKSKISQCRSEKSYPSQLFLDTLKTLEGRSREKNLSPEEQMAIKPVHDEAASEIETSINALIYLFSSVFEQYSLDTDSKFSKDLYYLLLDSELAQLLSEESVYFKKLLNTPMIEGKTREMNIPPEEYQTFRYITKILLDESPLIYNTVGDIVSMYRVADKYGIPAVTHTCKCFLKLYFSEHSEYLGYAEESDNPTSDKGIEIVKEIPEYLKEDRESEPKYEDLLQSQKRPVSREAASCSYGTSSFLSNERRSERLEEAKSKDDIKVEPLRIFLLRSVIEEPDGNETDNLLSPVWNEILGELSKDIKSYFETEVYKTGHIRKQRIGKYEWIYKKYNCPGNLWFEKLMEDTAKKETFDFYN